MAIRICPECGGKVSTTRDDCPHCGYVFPKTIICPECGEKIDDNLSECPMCGYRFSKQQIEQKPSTPVVKKAEENTPAPIEKKIEQKSATSIVEQKPIEQKPSTNSGINKKDTLAFGKNLFSKNPSGLSFSAATQPANSNAPFSVSTCPEGNKNSPYDVSFKVSGTIKKVSGLTFKSYLDNDSLYEEALPKILNSHSLLTRAMINAAVQVLKNYPEATEIIITSKQEQNKNQPSGEGMILVLIAIVAAVMLAIILAPFIVHLGMHGKFLLKNKFKDLVNNNKFKEFRKKFMKTGYIIYGSLFLLVIVAVILSMVTPLTILSPIALVLLVAFNIVFFVKSLKEAKKIRETSTDEEAESEAETTLEEPINKESGESTVSNVLMQDSTKSDEISLSGEETKTADNEIEVTTSLNNESVSSVDINNITSEQEEETHCVSDESSPVVINELVKEKQHSNLPSSKTILAFILSLFVSPLIVHLGMHGKFLLKDTFIGLINNKKLIKTRKIFMIIGYSMYAVLLALLIITFAFGLSLIEKLVILAMLLIFNIIFFFAGIKKADKIKKNSVDEDYITDVNEVGKKAKKPRLNKKIIIISAITAAVVVGGTTAGIIIGVEAPYFDFEYQISEYTTAYGNYKYKEASILRYKGSSEKVELPREIKGVRVSHIGDIAFSDCSFITSVVIPSTVVSIGDYAFQNCTSLTSITIPDGVTSIGDRAFLGCSSLTIYCEASSKPGEWSSNWNYSNCPVMWSVSTHGTYNDFKYVITNHGEVVIYGYIGTDTSVVIPELIEGDTVTKICENAFYRCTSLTSIYIPDSVTSIGYGAFAFCTSLTSIYIPDSVTYIGLDAFVYCSSLTIYCEASTEPSGWDSDWNFSNCPVVWGYSA